MKTTMSTALRRAAGTAAIVFALGAGAAFVEAQAASLPKSIAIAAGPQGSINFAISAGLAKVITKRTSMNVTVIPHSGTSTIMPAVAKGQLALGVTAGTPATFKSYLKKEQFDLAMRNMRIVSAGTPNTITLAVLADSDIHTAADLKGKRITARFSALPECQIHATALLDNLGLSWKDVRPVPVTSIIQAAQALAERRVDVMACGSPAIRKLREVNARTPVRFLSIDNSPQAMARALKHFAYIKQAKKLGKGAFGWLSSETWFLSYPWYLYGHNGLSDEVAYEVVKALWVHNADLKKGHPILRGWRPKAMVLKGASVAYHPGAIKFFREVGAWNAEMDTLQAKNLKRR